MDEISIPDQKLNKRWLSSISHESGESIHQLRYFSDSSVINMTFDSRSELRFQLSDDKMAILRNVLLGETGCYGLTGILQGKWV